MQGKDVLRTVLFLILSSAMASAQVSPDVAPLKNWPTPLFWQPNRVEDQLSRPIARMSGEARSVSAPADIATQASSPVGALVFVAMTPCRVVDTRSGFGFTGPFGPPGLVGGVPRSFPIQSSTNCSVPLIAQAYSFNVAIVPPTFVNWLTVWPLGQPQPNASTLNGWVNTIIANAAIVPAGNDGFGSVNVFASQSTDLIIDINGYYAPQTAITLSQGTAAAPSISFSGDPGTGIFSSGAATLNIATGGTSRLSVASNGDVSSTGNLNVSGNATVGGTLSGNVVNATAQYNMGGTRLLSVDGVRHNSFLGLGTPPANSAPFESSFFGYQAGANTTYGYNSFFGAYAGQANQGGGGNAFLGSYAGENITGDNNTFIGYSAAANVLTGSGNTVLGAAGGVGAGLTNATAIGQCARADGNNSLVLGSIAGVSCAASSTNVGIGTTTPGFPLDVRGTFDAVHGNSSSGNGVTGGSTTGIGVLGYTAGGGGSAGVVAVGTSFFKGDTTPLSPSVVGIGTGVAVGALSSPDIGYLFSWDYGANAARNLAINSPGGNVGIGTIHPDAALSVNGIADKTGGGSWAVFSDERLKNIAGPFTTGLDAVMQLRPLRYEYKPENALSLKSDGEHIGFSAQAVQKLIPDAVTADDQGYLLINNDPIMWSMLNAIQEQQARIEKQQEQIERQQNEAREHRTALATFEQQVEALKKLVCQSQPTVNVCN